MPQTSVTQAPAKAKEGLLYDPHPPTGGMLTGIVEQAAGIKPGRLCVRGAGGDFTAALPTGAGSLGVNVMGVSLFTHKALAIAPSSSDNEVHEDEAELPLLRRGRVWVIAEDAVDPSTDSVFVRVSAGAGGSEIGAFRTDADTASAVALAEARWLTSTSGTGELALLEINI